MAKRNILKLNAKPITFTVIGISSHENDYRVSWSLNEHLNMNFIQTDDLTTGETEFTRFVDETESRTIWLISNRGEDSFLLEKYRNIDFILQFTDILPDEEINNWLRVLRKAPLISTAFVIPFSKQILQKLG